MSVTLVMVPIGFLVLANLDQFKCLIRVIDRAPNVMIITNWAMMHFSIWALSIIYYMILVIGYLDLSRKGAQ